MGGLGSLLLLGLVAWFYWQRRSGESDRLAEILADAEHSGIISGEQHRAILARADASEPEAQVSGIAWLAILAGLFVLAGISLLIATNWERIGPEIRIGAFLLLLAAIGEATVRAQSRGAALALSLEIIWLILPLLGIGLYAQTFQLSGDSITSFLVWLVLAAPLAWRSTHPIVPTLHTASLVAVLLSGSFFAWGPLYLRGAPGLVAWALSVATLALVVVQSLQLLPAGQRYHCFGVVAAWTFGVLVSVGPFGIEDGSWAAVAALALTTLWLVSLLHAEAETTELYTAATTWLGILYAITFAWHANEPLEGPTTSAAMTGTLIAAGAALVQIARLPSPAGIRVVLTLPLALSFVLLLGGLQVVHGVAIAANLVLLAIAGALMWRGSTTRSLAEINFGILVLLVVLVTRFLDVFGTFVQTGLGFIVAGLLLAGLAYALQRTRRRLIDPTGEGAA